LSDFAKRSYPLIRRVQIEGLDESVGLGSDRPAIKYLKDSKDLKTEPSINEFKEIEEFHEHKCERVMLLRLY
jgi:hypothetical protein